MKAAKKMWIVPMFLLLVVFQSCKTSSSLGEKVKEPFSGNKYESTARYFRAKGKGDSSDENIAKKSSLVISKYLLFLFIGFLIFQINFLKGLQSNPFKKFIPSDLIAKLRRMH